MGVGKRRGVIRVDEEVIADGHGVLLDGFSNAFGVA